MSNFLGAVQLIYSMKINTFARYINDLIKWN